MIEITNKFKVGNVEITEMKNELDNEQVFIYIDKKNDIFKGIDISGVNSQEIILIAKELFEKDMNFVQGKLKNNKNNRYCDILLKYITKIEENEQKMDKIGSK